MREHDSRWKKKTFQNSISLPEIEKLRKKTFNAKKLNDPGVWNPPNFHGPSGFSKSRLDFSTV